MSFVVRLGEKRWLGPDGGVVETEEAAQRFELWRSPTIAERTRADMLAHELAGGLDAWTDLQQGLEGVRARLRKQVAETVWPDGQPDATTDAERQEQEQAFAAAWAANDSQDRALFSVLQGTSDKLDFLARWSVTWCPSMPARWRSLADCDVGDDTFWAIWNAYIDACNEVVEGK